ncbi:alpha/beta hydrolase fold domain-containing protein [Agromyces aurantiacus]|uniref:Alpha/beta hydrolase fold domain-containing protein n=1 Tax=Agromyces aurantiacus TaxID=165814 RepID=A0ABV9R2Z7_9MICO|nr:alpha/beta hydrolase fold domain-containing protein [Agromyces aurantiacus]MBM7503149.1 acetyl esterase/lipase [Agromyces aurantiacus]
MSHDSTETIEKGERMTQQAPYGAADGLVRVYPADAAAARPTAGLVWAHGGGFAAGDLDMPEADWVARAFAARGLTVVSIDYRLAVDAAGRYPAGSDDVLAAWRWALANADELGVDPSRLLAGGASAGANLVTGTVLRLLGHPTHSDSAGGAPAPGATPEAAPETRAPSAALTPPPAAGPAPSGPLPAGVFIAYPTLLAVQPAPDAALRALLDANPVADRFGPDVVRAMYENYLGGPVDGAPLPAVPGLAAPADLSGFPPVLMVNGEADELRVSGEAFAATLAAASVPVEVVTEPGTEHGHLNRPSEPAASVTVDRVVRWAADLETSAARTPPSRVGDLGGPAIADSAKIAHSRTQTTLRTTEGLTP